MFCVVLCIFFFLKNEPNFKKILLGLYETQKEACNLIFECVDMLHSIRPWTSYLINKGVTIYLVSYCYRHKNVIVLMFTANKCIFLQ